MHRYRCLCTYLRCTRAHLATGKGKDKFSHGSAVLSLAAAVARSLFGFHLPSLSPPSFGGSSEKAQGNMVIHRWHRGDTGHPHTLPPILAPKPTQPPAVATQPPAPQPTQPPTGVNGNPWGYDFNPGNLITNPPANFCHYFNCIPTFHAPDDPDGGYIVECQDGTYSQSGGESGSCCIMEAT